MSRSSLQEVFCKKRFFCFQNENRNNERARVSVQMKFPFRIPLVNVKTANLFAFTNEIPNEKIRFLCSFYAPFSSSKTGVCWLDKLDFLCVFSTVKRHVA